MQTASKMSEISQNRPHSKTSSRLFILFLKLDTTSREQLTIFLMNFNPNCNLKGKVKKYS